MCQGLVLLFCLFVCSWWWCWFCFVLFGVVRFQFCCCFVIVVVLLLLLLLFWGRGGAKHIFVRHLFRNMHPSITIYIFALFHAPLHHCSFTESFYKRDSFQSRPRPHVCNRPGTSCSTLRPHRVLAFLAVPNTIWGQNYCVGSKHGGGIQLPEQQYVNTRIMSSRSARQSSASSLTESQKCEREMY